MKPHLKLVRKGLWSCSGHGITRNGQGFKQAYDRWCVAVAQAARSAEPPVFTLPPVRIATPMTVRPDRIPEVRVGGAGAKYDESLVRQVAGTLQRPAYVPPRLLRINQARAAAHQPPMMSISSRAGDML